MPIKHTNWADMMKSRKDDFKSVSVKDTTIWRWKDPVIKRTTQALSKLGFFQSNSGDIVR